MATTLQSVPRRALQFPTYYFCFTLQADVFKAALMWPSPLRETLIYYALPPQASPACSLPLVLDIPHFCLLESLSQSLLKLFRIFFSFYDI
ncbi:hypothetical protein E2C01_084442 [Portunus trituberculatus]|uniref:Uncharacterized protein n=1 Tax=Portunus trituberculatus TaxID=210409 RepID=A0A5B7IVB1_PORTR|nr:hypothetical protein [Portunus trituberculatus]